MAAIDRCDQHGEGRKKKEGRRKVFKGEGKKEKGGRER